MLKFNNNIFNKVIIIINTLITISIIKNILFLIIIT
jgi:hypothetical protein